MTMWLGEATGNPVAVSLYVGDRDVRVNFDYVRRKRSPAEMARLAERLREVPGLAACIGRPEDKNWQAKPAIPMRILASEETLDAFKHAIIESANPATT